MSAPELYRLDGPGQPRALVLMLHGGQPDSHEPVGDRSGSFLRSRAMQHHIAGRLRREGLAVWLLRYTHRGWNAGAAAHPSPVPDARWALDEVRTQHGELPVVLLGHSMGARTAAAVADDPLVNGVVALAPWFPPGEPVQPLADKHLSAAHGRADRVTAFAATQQFVRRAGSVAASAELVDMGPLGHYMLRGARRWSDVAVDRAIRFATDDAGR